MEESNHCIICGNASGDQSGRILTAKGTNSVHTASVTRGDSVKNLLHNKECYVHNKCFKKYVDQRNLQKLKAESEYSETECALKTRSSGTSFDINIHCLICCNEIDISYFNKHPDRGSISLVRRDDNSLYETLIDRCSKRCDAEAIDIKARLQYTTHIGNAMYHRQCMQRFLTNPQEETDENPIRCKIFLDICEWLKQRQHSGPITLDEIRNEMSHQLPDTVSPYATKYLKQRLQNHFGECITITEGRGKASAVIFNSKDYKTQEQAESFGTLVRKKLQEMEQSETVYPDVNQMDIQQLEDSIPDALNNFFKTVFADGRSNQCTSPKNKLQQVAISHAVMQAAGKQTYISPLLLSLGLFIHQTTRSRVVLDVMSSLGFCVSYDRVIEFERSCVVSHSIQELPPGVVKQSDGGGFTQWVADNFDHVEDTYSGRNSTHAMGIITCQTSEAKDPRIHEIKREKIAADALLAAGDFGEFIRMYNKSPGKDIQMKPLSLEKSSGRFAYELVDLFWLISRNIFHKPTNWQGFMSKITKGVPQCTIIIRNPIMPLEPGTDEAVYSTMLYIRDQADKVGMCCACLTFDQPLFLKAFKIRNENNLSLGKVFLRLGGFHQLMSFLGSIGKLMEATGLEDLWATVYAMKSIPKMLQGKAYTKALRACLLTDAAIHNLLLQCDTQNGQADQRSTETSSRATPMKDIIDDISQAVSEESSLDAEFLTQLESLHELHNLAIQRKKQVSSRTGKLWLLFTEMVSIVRMFIRAERTGNWELHVDATKDMLPFFAAAGHNNYAKSCHLYLQDCEEMCQCIDGPFKEGLFTIHRSSEKLWNGTWTDMVIEQCFMRAAKTQGMASNLLTVK